MDNRALAAAVAGARKVIPVYVVSSWRGEHRWTGSNRQHFLSESLRSLAGNLQAMGGKLCVREGEAVGELAGLIAESGATLLTFNQDVDPHGRRVEDQLRQRLAGTGVEIVGCLDHSMQPPDALRTGAGDPYRVFTPYARTWRQLPRPQPGRPLRQIVVPEPFPAGETLPGVDHWALPPAGAGVLPGGERAARERLKHFLEGPAVHYGDQRDLPGVAGTSRISQDLRFGLLSIREIFHKLEEKMALAPAGIRTQLEKFASELIWREFYLQILHHYPEVLEEEFNPVFRGLAWPGRKEHLQRWQEGSTGFPIVDAGMRELRQTGFMHNRVRMITAMFLTKDLHLDWRLGESWFMQHLTDGEIASNNGGWQWSAGTGADAAPYFRIQNPWTQTKRYDPQGLYIKKWVPELRDVPPEKLAVEPETPLTPGYPRPVVHHASERDRTLEIFQKHKAAVGAG